MNAPDLYPSIDLRGGRVVRLLHGDYEREIDYGRDPVDVAEAFCAGGARWIHVVDLDAARTGTPVNRPIIEAIAAAVSGRTAVQTGGGVRTLADALTLRDAGVARVVMGSTAVANPRLVDEISQRVDVAVGLDHRRGVIAVHGWTEESGVTVADALGRFAAATTFVITDISRDGALAGPDVAGLRAAVAATSTPVIASGGVSSLEDIRALAAIPGLGGIITGRAVYEEHITVAGAIAAIGEVFKAAP